MLLGKIVNKNINNHENREPIHFEVKTLQWLGKHQDHELLGNSWSINGPLIEKIEILNIYLACKCLQMSFCSNRS